MPAATGPGRAGPGARPGRRPRRACGARLARRSQTAPVIAVTYSAPEFATWDQVSPWQFTLRAIVAAGGVPLAIDCSSPQPAISRLVALGDGLIVLGGGDIDPARYRGNPADPTVSGVSGVRDAGELAALAAVRSLARPALAICRGFHLLNIAHGGALITDLARDRPGSITHQPGMAAPMRTQHEVHLAAGSRPARWMGRSDLVTVNSEHHQGVAEAGPGLVVTGRAADGLVEAVETIDGLAVGVQWHPEMLWPGDENALALLRGFVSECAAAGSPRA